MIKAYKDLKIATRVVKVELDFFLDFPNAVDLCKKLSKDLGCPIQYRFNGVKITIDEFSDSGNEFTRYQRLLK